MALEDLGLNVVREADGGALQLVGRGEHVVAVDQEDRSEGDFRALLGIEQFDVDLLALGDTGLFPTGSDHCIHSPASLAGRDQPFPPRIVEKTGRTAVGPASATMCQHDDHQEEPLDATSLREMQAPIKARYRDDPGSAVITLRAAGSVDGASLTCKVETGRALATAGLHPATGGSGLELCSGDMLLEALVACAGVTLKSVATAIGVEVRNGRVAAEGDLDFRGTLGVAKDAPVGFARIALRFELDTDATDEQLADLLRLTERYCVVYQTIAGGTTCAAEVARC